MKYSIAAGKTLLELQERVNERLQMGYRPSGSLVATVGGPDNTAVLYIQPMMLVEGTSEDDYVNDDYDNYYDTPPWDENA